MDVLIAIFGLALATAVVALISGPLRQAQRNEAAAAISGEAPSPEPEQDEHEHRAELEAAREAKYREIRDAELDYRTGKLSSADYEAIDLQLRAEALAILDQLEALEAPETGPADGALSD